MTQVLSIAGSDSCGGAGLQADLKTFAAFGVDGATVVTAVTAQNTAGVRAIQTMPAAMVQAQMDAVFEELAIDAVKLGMLANADIVATVAQQLQRWRPPFVVLDPVLLATSGTQLLEAAAVDRLRARLLPLADCLTPNLAEAAALLSKAGPNKYTPHTPQVLAKVLAPAAEDRAGYIASGAIAHQQWDEKRIDFQPYPFPSYTEALVKHLKGTLIEGDSGFLAGLDPAQVARDLVDDRFVRTAIEAAGGLAAFGQPDSFERHEEFAV